MYTRLRELRFLATIVIAVCMVLLAAIYSETHFERLRSRDHNRWEQWMLWSQYWILSTSAAGIWMASVWSSLYGKNTLFRLAVTILLIAGMSTLGWLTYHLFGSFVPANRRFDLATLGAVVAAASGFFVICVLPLLAMRWLRAWEILNEEDASAVQAPGRYPLKGIFCFTTATAVVCAVLIWVIDILRVGDRGNELVYFIYNAMPSIGGLLLLMAMSRMRIRLIWPTVCLLGVCVAGTIALGLSFTSGWRFDWQRTIFLPTLVGFIYAAFLTLLAALRLRTRDFLIRCGGSSGFAAIRVETRPFPRRAVAVALTCALLAGVSFGGWKYYSHWEIMKSAIAAEPTLDDLPRLMRVACHYATGSDSQEISNMINERRREASDAIVSLGDQAIPFLLDRLTEQVDDQSDTISSTAGRLLSGIGKQNNFGAYKDRVLLTITGDEQAFFNSWGALVNVGADAVPTVVELLKAHDDHSYLAAMLLARIGPPHSVSAIPALKQACLAEFPSESGFYSPGILYHALVTLAGSDAMPTLMKVLEDKENYSLKKRVNAASAIGKLGAEGVIVLPIIDDLLVEVNAAGKGTVSKDKRRSRYYEIENLQTLLIESIARFGTAAESVAPRLLQMVESSEVESRLRSSLVKALGRLQVAEAVPKLQQIVQEETQGSSVQAIAVAALGEIGPPAENTIDTIEEYITASRRWDRHSRLIASEVAKARILMAQRELLTRSLLNRISQSVDNTGTSEAFQNDTSQEVAALCALIWLGAEEDEQVMRQQAQISLNGDDQNLSLHFAADPALAMMPMSRLLEGVFSGRYDRDASFDDRWTTDGKVRSLLKSLEVGLQADEATTRLAASDLLAAMGSLSLPEAPALHICLADENPRVRLRAAIALLLAGEESEEVYSALRDKDEPDWAGLRLPLKQLIEARVVQQMNK